MRLRLFFSYHKDWNTAVFEHAMAAGYSVTTGPINDFDLARFDGVVPIHLRCQRVVRDRIARGESVAALVVSQDVENLCHDKFAFNRAAIRLGFANNIPKMIAPDQVCDADFPLILKHRHDTWGQRSRIVRDRKDSVFATGTEPDCFLQRYIPGSEEYATHFLLKDGQILFHATYRYRWAHAPYVQGRHYRPPPAERQAMTPALDTFRRLLDAIGYRNGTCCIDYRLDNGSPMIFEINPRFGCSLLHRLGDYLHAYVAAVANARATSGALIS